MTTTRCNFSRGRALERVLSELHLDVAISLGAIVSVHGSQIPDAVVWQITRSLSALFRRQKRQLRAGETDPQSPPALHPAVALLIAELRAARSERKSS